MEGISMGAVQNNPMPLDFPNNYNENGIVPPSFLNNFRNSCSSPSPETELELSPRNERMSSAPIPLKEGDDLEYLESGDDLDYLDNNSLPDSTQKAKDGIRNFMQDMKQLQTNIMSRSLGDSDTKGVDDSKEFGEFLDACSQEDLEEMIEAEIHFALKRGGSKEEVVSRIKREITEHVQELGKAINFLLTKEEKDPRYKENIDILSKSLRCYEVILGVLEFSLKRKRSSAYS